MTNVKLFVIIKKGRIIILKVEYDLDNENIISDDWNAELLSKYEFVNVNFM